MRRMMVKGNMKNSIIRVALIVALILLIPVFGNLYIDGWNWGPLDFVIMGGLLFLVGMAIDAVARKVTNPVWKTISILGIILVFLAIWVEMAVGAVSRFLSFVF